MKNLLYSSVFVLCTFSCSHPDHEHHENTTSEVLQLKLEYKTGIEKPFHLLKKNDEIWALVNEGSANDAKIRWSIRDSLLNEKNNRYLSLPYAWTNGNRVQEMSDGSFFILGTCKDNANDNTDALIVKVDPNGDVIWYQRAGGSDNDDFISVISTANNELLIAGTTSSKGKGFRDIYLVKTDASGNMVMEKTYGTSGNDGSTKLFSLKNELFLFAYSDGIGAGDRDLVLMKISTNLDSLWGKTYGGAIYEQSGEAFITPDQNILLCGHSSSFGDIEHDNYLVKADTDGNILWQKTFGGTAHQGIDVALALKNGRYAFTGYTGKHENHAISTVHFSECDENGNLLRQHITLDVPGVSVGTCLLELDNRILVAGYTFKDPVNGIFYLTVKK